ncbi:MAG: S49 family peptidase [Bdellovibrionales bacterium]
MGVVKTTVCKTCEVVGNLPVIGGIFKPKPKVAILRFSGVIADAGMKRGGISYHKYRSFIDEAFDVFDLKAVALVINSPGGSPAQSQLIGDHIRRLAEEKEVPVYAFIEDVAASGGYWLACAADEIYGVSSSISGSIGVISAGFGFSELIAKHGVERRIHTAGKDKSFYDPFVEEKPADVKRLKALQTNMHDIFKDWVRERRGERLTGADKDVFEGQFWTSSTAIELGVIDGLGEVRSFAKDKFGESIKFTEIGPEKKLMPSLFGFDAKNTLQGSMAEDIVETIETKTAWGRFGI